MILQNRDNSGGAYRHRVPRMNPTLVSLSRGFPGLRPVPKRWRHRLRFASTTLPPHSRTRCAFFALVLVVLAPALSAAESVEDIFKRALFAEEGHRDFEAAVRDYQQVVRSMDEQRRLAATAVFRLGECYRKLNRTNDAIAQYQRVVAEFPAEATLVQISRQNLVGLGVETPGTREALGVAGAGGAVPVQDAGRAQDDGAQPDRLVAQIATLRRMKDDPRRQALAVQALFPDETLDKLLTRLPDLQRQTEILRSFKRWPTALASQGTPAVLFGPGVSGLVQRPSFEESPNAVPAEEQEKLTQQHLALIAERVEHILVLQEARLQVLQASSASPQAGRPGVPSSDGIARLEQELSLLEAQLEALKAMDSGKIRSGLKTFFPGEARGILDLERQLTEYEIQDTRLDVSLAGDHPDRVALRRMMDLWKKKLAQETDDVLGSQVARRDVLRTTLEQIRKSAPTRPMAASGAPGVDAATNEEEVEIRRIQTLVANSPDLINANRGKTWPLYAAAQKGQLAVARYLLDHGAKTRLGSSGSTPLHAAAEAGHKAMVELLLGRGAPTDAIDSYGCTPLHLAVRAGFLGIAEVLLEKGANPNAPSPRQKDYTADNVNLGVPLNAALNLDRLDLVRLLLGKGANPNSRDEGQEVPRDSGNPPLRFAASIDAVRLMLSKGANPNLPYRDGTTRLHAAAQKGDLAVMEVLLKGGALLDGSTNAASPVLTPLGTAVHAGQLEAAEWLLKHGASIDRLGGGEAPLHAALGLGDFDRVKWVLDHGANPNVPNVNRVTPLEMGMKADAGRGGVQPPGIPGIAMPVPGIPVPVPRSIPNRAVPGGASPLGTVAVSSNTGAASEADAVPGRFVRLLLERGADINVAFSDGSRLIHHLMRQEMGAPGWTKFLAQKPDVNARGPRQVTPLMIAVCAGNSDGFKALLEAGADVNTQDELGNAPLHFAANNRSDFVGWLMKAKADPGVTNRFGTTPIDLVRSGGWTGINVDAFGVLVPLYPVGAFRQSIAMINSPASGDNKRRDELLRQLGVATNDVSKASGGGTAYQRAYEQILRERQGVPVPDIGVPPLPQPGPDGAKPAP